MPMTLWNILSKETCALWDFYFAGHGRRTYSPSHTNEVILVGSTNNMVAFYAKSFVLSFNWILLELLFYHCCYCVVMLLATSSPILGEEWDKNLIR